MLFSPTPHHFLNLVQYHQEILNRLNPVPYLHPLLKADDIVGRVKVYESLVKGKVINQAGVPESFRVLVKEFQALGLDVQVINNEDEVVEFKDIEEEVRPSYKTTLPSFSIPALAISSQISSHVALSNTGVA